MDERGIPAHSAMKETANDSIGSEGNSGLSDKGMDTTDTETDFVSVEKVFKYITPYP